jgi:hypothetical protein
MKFRLDMKKASLLKLNLSILLVTYGKRLNSLFEDSENLSNKNPKLIAY